MDTQLSLYDFVMGHLRAKRIPQRRVAADTGIPFSTLTKIAQGLVKDPSVHNIQRLADYFRSDSAQRLIETSRAHLGINHKEAA